MKGSVGTACGASLALAVFLYFATQVLAQDGAFAVCIQNLAERDLAGRTAFQKAVRGLIVAERPELEPLASLHMSHQIALAQTRAAMITYLSAHTPGRIDTSSLSKFRNFGWGTADDTALAAENPEVGRLLEGAAELRKQSDGHPDWPKLQQFMRTELSPDPAFRDLIAEIANNDRAVRKGLDNCRRE